MPRPLGRGRLTSRLPGAKSSFMPCSASCHSFSIYSAKTRAGAGRASRTAQQAAGTEVNQYILRRSSSWLFTGSSRQRTQTQPPAALSACPTLPAPARPTAFSTCPRPACSTPACPCSACSTPACSYQACPCPACPCPAYSPLCRSCPACPGGLAVLPRQQGQGGGEAAFLRPGLLLFTKSFPR